MKRLNITTYGMILLLMMGSPLMAEPAGTEAELQLLERELDQEQERLDQRRHDLKLRRLRLELRKNGQDLPKNGEMNDAEKAAQLAQLQAQVQAEKSRKLWITHWQQAKDLLEPDKTERRMGSPKAFGRKAKAKEEEAAVAKKLAETQIKEFEEYILTSMQTTLTDKGSLTDAELKWLESLVAKPADEEAQPVTDEATRRRVKLILDMARDRKDAASGKTVPVIVE